MIGAETNGLPTTASLVFVIVVIYLALRAVERARYDDDFHDLRRNERARRRLRRHR